jgi:hypothetical protein
MKVKVLFIIALLLTLVQGAQAQHNVTRDATMSESWSVTPDNPVSAGATVTATYNGSRHVKSVKYRPAGTIGGKFTINGSGDKVYFSKGNLQQTGENSWKFADNQWETFGENQSNNHRDLFTWSKWSEDAGIQASLGTGWRALMGSGEGEWYYLLETRTVNGGKSAGHSYTLGQSVNGVLGLVLYPDDYSGAAYTTGADWAGFEAAGCVFLPAAGFDDGSVSGVSGVGSNGRYWSSTLSDAEDAYDIYFESGLIAFSNSDYRSWKLSVRLVFPAE